MPRTVLVLGSDGMAGSMITQYLKERGHIIIATTRRKTSAGNIYFDAANDLEGLDKIIDKNKPEYVINCIGILNQQAEDNHPLAVKLNALLPQYADKLSDKYGYKLIHISTDCVFSGDKGGYKEDDTPDAKSFYGRSKAAGEIREGRNLTLRTSIIGPDPNPDGIGLFNWFMAQEGQINGYSKAIWSGVTTLQLAKSIEDSFTKNINGLYHLVNNEPIDKYNLLLLFMKYMNKDIDIVSTDEYVNNKSLINTESKPRLVVPDYNVMTKQMSEWIADHKSMYPSYISKGVSYAE